MKIRKACWLISILFLLSACSQALIEWPSQGSHSTLTPRGYLAASGAYSEYGDVRNLRYYKGVLDSGKWREAKTINYSPGYFAFPPLAGHRVLHYDNPKRRTQIVLNRDIIGEDETYMDLISRRQARDHCTFTSSFYRRLKDIDIVEANAKHYVWLYGDYLCKYYFVKAGNVLYTFRLLSPSKQYFLYEPEFDYFVDNTMNEYLIYSPRQQLTPTPTKFASNKSRRQIPFGSLSQKDLISFFAPAGIKDILPQ